MANQKTEKYEHDAECWGDSDALKHLFFDSVNNSHCSLNEVMDKVRLTLPDAPKILIGRASKSFIGWAVTEVFSEKTPILPRNEDEGLVPIDALLGSYCRQNRKIEIYYKNIKSLSRAHKWDYEKVLYIVRCHEWAHAYLHASIPQSFADARYDPDANGNMYPQQVDPETNWGSYLNAREVKYSSLSTEGHEFYAQALTYSALHLLPEKTFREFIEAFDYLELKQPSIYQIPIHLKSQLPTTSWPLFFEFFGGNFWNLSTLLADKKIEIGTDKDYLLGFLRKISLEFDEGRKEIDCDLTYSEDQVSKSPHPGSIEFLVKKIGKVFVYINPREHGIPHFHVQASNATAACDLRDGTIITGSLPGKARFLLKDWFEKNRGVLIQIWDKTRPTNCPIGTFVDFWKPKGSHL